MTCIVGVEHDGKVYMGADSAGVGGYDITVRADDKLFRNGEFLIGYTTSFRMGQLLQFAFTPPKHKRGKDPMAFMVADVVPAIRECLKAGGYTKTDNGRDEGGTFIVGYRGGLYTVYDDFQVARGATGYNAVGCGRAYALGSLHALRENVDFRDPCSRINEALLAANEFSAGVCPPFKVMSL